MSNIIEFPKPKPKNEKDEEGRVSHRDLLRAVAKIKANDTVIILNDDEAMTVYSTSPNIFTTGEIVYNGYMGVVTALEEVINTIGDIEEE